MYKLVKTSKAKNDLVAIWQYTYEEWGRERANAYLMELEVSLKLLLNNPMLYQERNEFDPPIRFMKFKRHICIYLIIDFEVQVIRVLHENMDILNQMD